jgi:hypothetical protein
VPGEAEIVAHAQLREDPAPLRHVADPEPGPFIGRQAIDLDAMKPDRAGTGRQEPHDGLEQGGFTHAVVTENAHDLVFRHGKLDSVQDRHLAVASRQALDIQAGLAVLGHDQAFFPR